jgi:hypothetical protein
MRPTDDESRRRLAKEGKKIVVPFDEATGMDKLPFKISPEMMLWLTEWALNQGSYEASQQAVQKIQKRISKEEITINDDTIRQVTNHIGKIVYTNDLRDAEDAFALKYMPTRRTRFKKREILYVEADGASVNTNSHGWKKGKAIPVSNYKKKPGKKADDANKESTWKENKLGVAFCSDNIKWHKTPENVEWHEILAREYTCVLGPVEQFKKMLFSIACKNGFFDYETTVFISDGAAWLGIMANELFNFNGENKFVHILDLYHLKEKVYLYSKEYIKNDSKKAKEWADDICDLLEESRSSEVLEILKPIQDKREITPNLPKYIESNRERIDYKYYRSMGYFVGSGVVESGNKVVMQSRMKRAGQRWGTESGQYMLSLLSKRESTGLWEKEVVATIRKLYTCDYEKIFS